MTKSKQGFTLIELLVVIGILAVLAAIAIPAVAGLIDRANISSDKTNANEMTNAIERFASEYELYKNDINMGTIPNDDMDTAQGRVYNVIGATTKAEITELETLGSDNAILINDERYPTTDEMMKKVVEAYTKTSTSTFDPRQSDKCFWYSPECGIVVVAEHNSTVLQKNELVVSGKDAKGNDLDGDTVWIDITPVGGNVDNGNDNNETPAPVLTPIPLGGVYTVAETSEVLIGDGATVMFPTEVKTGDMYAFGTYVYKYNYVGTNVPYVNTEAAWTENISQNGWGVKQSAYNINPVSEILDSVNNQPITNMDFTFFGNDYITTVPAIPSTVTSLKNTFNSCELLDLPPDYVIPFGVINMYQTFAECSSLTNAPVIPNSVENMKDTFRNCTSLVVATNVSTSATDISSSYQNCTSLEDISKVSIPATTTSASSMFSGCTSLEYAGDLSIQGNDVAIGSLFKDCINLKTAPVIPQTVRAISNTFNGCTSLTGIIEINVDLSASYMHNNTFSGVDFAIQNITLTGTSQRLDAIGATGTNYCATCNGTCKGTH